MATATQIRDCAKDIQRQAPALTTGVTLSPTLRGLLEALARMAELPAPVIHKAHDNDLISVYLVALKDGDSAKRVAAKIGFRLDDTLFGAPGSAPKAPEPLPEPFKAPPRAGTAPERPRRRYADPSRHGRRSGAGRRA